MSDTSTSDRVLGAADQLFYTRGFQAVGMDDVRSASGVTLRRLYSLFASKEELVLAVLRRRRDLWTDGVTAKAAEATTPRERLLAIYDFLADWFADGSFRGCCFINAFGELGTTSPAVAELARAQKQSFQDYVAGIVAEAGAGAVLAPQLALLAEGAQTTAAIAGNSDAAHQARDAAEILIDAASR